MFSFFLLFLYFLSFFFFVLNFLSLFIIISFFFFLSIHSFCFHFTSFKSSYLLSHLFFFLVPVFPFFSILNSFLPSSLLLFVRRLNLFHLVRHFLFPFLHFLFFPSFPAIVFVFFFSPLLFFVFLTFFSSIYLHVIFSFYNTHYFFLLRFHFSCPFLPMIFVLFPRIAYGSSFLFSFSFNGFIWFIPSNEHKVIVHSNVLMGFASVHKCVRLS